MGKIKKRADQILYEQGLVESREKGKRLIMAGNVFLLNNDGQREPVKKPGQQLPEKARFFIQAQERFVSRGGEKLLTALQEFSLSVQGLVALDVGASTGGFTDCLLQHGAIRVYALDVGHGQLHFRLRKDPRVVNLERINIRFASRELLPEPVDLVVVDCSFISLRLVLLSAMQFLKPKGQIIALVKPQFEVPRGMTSKGVVRSRELQSQVLQEIKMFVETELHLVCQGIVPAKIKGPKGNQEFLFWMTRIPNPRVRSPSCQS